MPPVAAFDDTERKAMPNVFADWEMGAAESWPAVTLKALIDPPFGLT